MSIRLRDVRGSCYDKILMTLKAYLDDSGKLSDPNEKAAVVGGCIATVDEWSKLEPEWWQVIHEYEVTEFHAVDFAHFRGDFTGWTEDKRRTFLNRLMEIMQRHLYNPSKPIGAFLPLSQFRDLPPEKQSEWGGDPYFVCLEHCIRLAAVHAQDLYKPPENVEIFCDEQPKFEGIANRVYRACEEYLPNGIGGRLSGFAFGKSIKWAGLQVADFVAYEGLQLQRKRITGKLDIDKIRWSLNRLMVFQCEFEYFSDRKKLSKRSPLINYSQR